MKKHVSTLKLEDDDDEKVGPIATPTKAVETKKQEPITPAAESDYDDGDLF